MRFATSFLCGASVAAAAVLAAPAAVEAQDKPVELRASHWVPPTHPVQKAMEAWGESVAKASNGTITVKVFPAQQLGKAQDHYDMARDGIADISFVNPGYQPGRFPIIAAGELPFLIANAKGGSKAVDEWYRNYAAKEMKEVKYCLTHLHDPGTIHAKKRIDSPEQIKGMKIRPAHGTTAAWVTLLGGTNAHSSAPEAREILERGVADAITFPWNSILLFKIDSVTKFHIDAPMYTTTFTWAMSPAKYNSLSAAQKKVIDDHCTPEWAEKVAAGWADYEASGKEKIAGTPGHTVYKLTPEQSAQWRKSAEPLVKQWAESVKKAGNDADTVMNALNAALKKNNASY
jgi:TRAP-type C4-dicarboxylate transport system substrate-binding protein